MIICGSGILWTFCKDEKLRRHGKKKGPSVTDFTHQSIIRINQHHRHRNYQLSLHYEVFYYIVQPIISTWAVLWKTSWPVLWIKVFDKSKPILIFKRENLQNFKSPNGLWVHSSLLEAALYLSRRSVLTYSHAPRSHFCKLPCGICALSVFLWVWTTWIQTWIVNM